MYPYIYIYIYILFFCTVRLPLVIVSKSQARVAPTPPSIAAGKSPADSQKPKKPSPRPRTATDPMSVANPQRIPLRQAAKIETKSRTTAQHHQAISWKRKALTLYDFYGGDNVVLAPPSAGLQTII